MQHSGKNNIVIIETIDSRHEWVRWKFPYLEQIPTPIGSQWFSFTLMYSTYQNTRTPKSLKGRSKAKVLMYIKIKRDKKDRCYWLTICLFFENYYYLKTGTKLPLSTMWMQHVGIFNLQLVEKKCFKIQTKITFNLWKMERDFHKYQLIITSYLIQNCQYSRFNRIL